ncbi:MAG TPA: 23S rRNA (pseudouridine(1915)-N(3))-methyltransferase RlmH [Firmicutes bacterium]|nr:23S rRNA (pseudouridine(1915)-N(3))-methyltransferase RlmH [Bacillota bacterium]
MRVRIVCVGKLKEEYWRAALAEYAKRLARFCRLEVTELPERRTPEEEADAILRACRGHVFALAVEGKQVSSEQFAAEIASLCDAGKEMTFVIGSSCGLAERVKRQADGLLSFSKMTFPHQMMRVILAEQIYRAFMIAAGAEYHK